MSCFRPGDVFNQPPARCNCLEVNVIGFVHSRQIDKPIFEDKRLAAGQMQTKNVQAVSGVVGAMTKAALAIVLAAVFDLMADIDYLADARLQLRTPDDRTRTAISLQLAARYEPPYGL